MDKDFLSFLKIGLIVGFIVSCIFLFGIAPNEWLPFYTFLPIYFQETPIYFYLTDILTIVFIILIFGGVVYIFKEKIF